VVLFYKNDRTGAQNYRMPNGLVSLMLHAK
jgi:hypothetical protein